MNLDPNNPVVVLCARGLEMEGAGKHEEAGKLFRQAWGLASDNFEKLVAAHYLARQQPTVLDKIIWNETALQFAWDLPSEDVKEFMPSLYLNIAKCHEELQNGDEAVRNYQLADWFSAALPKQGYGTRILGGILNGLQRLNATVNRVAVSE